MLVAAPRCPLHSWDKWDIPYAAGDRGAREDREWGVGTGESQSGAADAEGNSETRTRSLSLSAAHALR